MGTPTDPRTSTLTAAAWILAALATLGWLTTLAVTIGVTLAATTALRRTIRAVVNHHATALTGRLDAIQQAQRANTAAEFQAYLAGKLERDE